MVKAALETIDLESHCGSHPRLGIVDHICFHPLAQTSLDQAAWLARSVAADIGSNLHGLYSFSSKSWKKRFTYAKHKYTYVQVRLAKCLSERGGGIPSVQAMALAHGEDITEVACNLLEPSRVGADKVQREVERLAKKEGLSVGMGYFTDFSQEKIIQKYLKEYL
ncbi:hypothetical protein IFM89_027268 [Coptis chinensis]|uniref:Formiminotransferase N-terminal subdomain domain-containing protein n=1 Tax=Coptis chinensis TaxID=261450 RepID=A0A835H184_9MAGN|nr:hypothetical protein IFM89_027268 [Coptis chinensis]